VKTLALELVTNKRVYPAPEQGWLGWRRVALAICRNDPRRVAGFIFDLQGTRDAASTFFLEHREEARRVLDECIAADPAGAWEEMVRYLRKGTWGRFSIGFPPELMSHLPHDAILGWIAEDAADRASIIAHLMKPTLENDGDLDARLIDQYGHDANVRSALFSKLISGTSWGSLADKWRELAGQMEKAAARTQLPNVRAWALEARQSLLEMEKREREQETDEAIRSR
jgi:hypothetical protein